jgi:hypothetical protein
MPRKALTQACPLGLTPNPSGSGSREEAHRDNDGAERCGARSGGSHGEKRDSPL